VLELIDLKHSYGHVTALDGLSFVVQEGEMLGFVGPNGAGKTTAMRVILGLLEPSSGEVRWRGQAISGGPPSRWSREGRSSSASARRRFSIRRPSHCFSSPVTRSTRVYLPFLVRSCRASRSCSSTAPMSILLFASYFIGITATNNPDSTLVTVASYLPPSAPLAMPQRAILGEASAVEVGLSMAITLAAAAALIPIAGRLYTGGILRMGGVVKLREAWRSVA
jgi:energy-coupling factor transporter ATP-binding protein EcfA2